MGLLKTSTKIYLDVALKDNVRSKNPKTLSVGQDIVNCIFLDESMEFIKLKNLSKSSLECSHKTNTSSRKHFQHFRAVT